MKRLIALFMLFAVSCGGGPRIDPIVTMYPFLIQSAPCKGSILMPAENVAIQQKGKKNGPYYSRTFMDACFIVTTTGPSTISIETTPLSKTDIRFLSSELQKYNSDYEIDPITPPILDDLNAAKVRISSTHKFDFYITIN